MNSLGLKVGMEANHLHFANFDVLTMWKNETRYIRTDFSNTEALEADKLYLFVNNEKEMELAQNALPQSLYSTISRDGMIMIMHEDATKIKAVEYLASFYNINMEGVVAFGDDVNDIDMLENVGRAIAMANAIPELKKKADDVCGTNEEDGVARWLESNILIS